jgi:serine/threonine-protein kinase RsbW
LRQCTQPLGLSEDQYSNCVIALTEAVNNGIVHGNKRNEAKSVLIEISFAHPTLTMIIQDEGVGFDPDSLPDPTDPANLLLDGGRGVLIIRALMTRAEFIKIDNGAQTRLELDLA